MQKTIETFEIGSVTLEKNGVRVHFSPEDRATAKLSVGYRGAENPGFKPGQKVRVTVELVNE
jgi:hypothetical protein